MLNKTLIFIIFMAVGSAANATEVVRWTDAQGQIHFGNPQFAPAGQAQSVHVRPANGMHVPQTPRIRSSSASPQVAYIKKAAKKNKRGWRGYSRAPGRAGRHHR